MANSESTSPSELQRRLVFSLLRPVARLARRFALPLKTVEELARLAYYAEARRDQTPQAEVARRFGKSLRTIGSLERLLRSNFLAPEVEVEAFRRIEAALEQEPGTIAEVGERAGMDLDDVTRLMRGLAASGRVVKQPDGRYALDRRFQSLVRQDLKARVDGLNHQLDVVLGAVQARFLSPSREAMARTLDFVVRAEDVPALADAIVRALRSEVIEAEETALKKGGFDGYGLTIALAPRAEDDE